MRWFEFYFNRINLPAIPEFSSASALLSPKVIKTLGAPGVPH